MKKVTALICLFLIVGTAVFTSTVYADDGTNIAYATRGLRKILSSTVAIPAAVIQDSQRVMFPFGIVTGVVRGTMNMVGGIVGGAVDVARGGAPYAKYAALAL